MVLKLTRHVHCFNVKQFPTAFQASCRRDNRMVSVSGLLWNTHSGGVFMKSHLLKPMAVFLITVSTSAAADGHRLDPARPGAGSGDYSRPGSNAAPYVNKSTTGPAVPGGSYRNQAPPRYRIEQGSGSSTSAFPRVPGTSYRDYSRPSYNTR